MTNDVTLSIKENCPLSLIPKKGRKWGGEQVCCSLHLLILAFWLKQRNLIRGENNFLLNVNPSIFFLDVTMIISYLSPRGGDLGKAGLSHQIHDLQKPRASPMSSAHPEGLACSWLLLSAHALPCPALPFAPMCAVITLSCRNSHQGYQGSLSHRISVSWEEFVNYHRSEGLEGENRFLSQQHNFKIQQKSISDLHAASGPGHGHFPAPSRLSPSCPFPCCFFLSPLYSPTLS